jgi:hypothetical protein
MMSNHNKPQVDPPPDVRNDSGMSVAQAEAILDKTGVTIRYGDISLRVESHALDDARPQVMQWTPEERHRAMLSVERALHKAMPKVRAMTASKKVMDDTCADLVLWTALTETSVS